MKNSLKYVEMLNSLLICFLLVVFVCVESKAQKATNNTPGNDTCSADLISISPQVALVKAISDENVECVKKILQTGINPNFKVNNEYGTFPILLALVKANSKIIAELLKAGADIKGEEGKDALIIASSKGYLDIIEEFLKAGADVNTLFKGKVTPLMAASYHNQKDLVEYLLKSKADVNLLSNDGASSLMLSSDNSRIVDLLIKAGANIDAVDNQGQTALFYAVKNCQTNKVKILLKNDANIDVKDKNGLTTSNLIEQTENAECKMKLIKIFKEIKTK